ncbi:ester cyclase [Novosphingobium sp. 1949]|uniref:Ester cyclase n=1 Tax=Novosphingobium organovorum TaxID=2930092 RepID=A0ABT0BC33_9SPHN|nr:ester cyclase [Novosphingobium organovorum]MCJ2182593.1 ester cyclase [Novosphingobium organovorum]
MTSARIVRLRAFIERVWNEGDSAAVDDYLAPAYTIHSDPGDPWEGRTLDVHGFIERLETSRAPCPDQRFTILHASEEHDRVALFWSWSATHSGAIAGFASSGARITMTGASLYAFDARDRLTGHWQIADRLGVLRQLQRAAGAQGG